MLARNIRQICRLPVRHSAVATKSTVGCVCYNERQAQGSFNHDTIGLHMPHKVSLNRQVRFFSSSPRYLTQKENETQEETVPIAERIEKLVKRNKVVIFMKGVPDEPRCGFSNAVVQVLRMHGVENYDAHNVLADEEIRQGIKDYSDWPTIPQVYFEGEFIGGCDILLQMHQNGELIEELGKLGIKSALDKTT